MRADRWIGYTRAAEALGRLETLFTWPSRQRMPNLLLTGPTNNGKSMIIEKFRRAHPPVSHPDREEIPVLAVQMPSDPSVGRFYTVLLAATGAPLRAGQPRVADLEQLALRVLRAAGRPGPGHRRAAPRPQRPGRPAPRVPEPAPVPGQRAAHPAGRRRHARGLPGDPLR